MAGETSQALHNRVLKHLNRPVEDDFYTTAEVYEALERAQGKYRDELAQIAPKLTRETRTLPAEGGFTFTLPDDHLGKLEVWGPPGPPLGDMLRPVLPELGIPGFYIQEREIKFTYSVSYNALYIRWTPATDPVLNADTDPVLPRYCFEAITFFAAYLLALKAGYLGDPMMFRSAANMAWERVPPIVQSQAEYEGVESVEPYDAPWYYGLPGYQSAQAGFDGGVGGVPNYERVYVWVSVSAAAPDDVPVGATDFGAVPHSGASAGAVPQIDDAGGEYLFVAQPVDAAEIIGARYGGAEMSPFMKGADTFNYADTVHAYEWWRTTHRILPTASGRDIAFEREG